jgi:very-short-patch-repair endonuclease
MGGFTCVASLRLQIPPPAPLGPFIVDLACVSHCLVIEADGGQHADSAQDKRRTDWLSRRGWRILRFWNNDILANSEAVQDAILRELALRRVGRIGSGPSPSRP